eukprot:COSAG01_NODE_5881_length_3971_cov_6.184353_5_plen_129_part_00
MFHANAYVVTSAASAASGITVPQSPPLPLQILEGPLLGEMPASDGAWRFTGATRSPTAAAAAACEKEEDIPDSEGAGFFAAGAGTPLRGGTVWHHPPPTIDSQWWSICGRGLLPHDCLRCRVQIPPCA